MTIRRKAPPDATNAIMAVLESEVVLAKHGRYDLAQRIIQEVRRVREVAGWAEVPQLKVNKLEAAVLRRVLGPETNVLRLVEYLRDEYHLPIEVTK